MSQMLEILNCFNKQLGALLKQIKKKTEYSRKETEVIK